LKKRSCAPDGGWAVGLGLWKLELKNCKELQELQNHLGSRKNCKIIWALCARIAKSFGRFAQEFDKSFGRFAQEFDKSFGCFAQELLNHLGASRPNNSSN